MRTIAEAVEDIKSILNNIERTESCDGETLVDINELADEILTISAYKGKKQTNADRIRSMSDEEFAEFWLQHCDNPIMEFNEDICDLCNTYKSRGQCDDEYCKEAIVKWLQSEVEE